VGGWKRLSFVLVVGGGLLLSTVDCSHIISDGSKTIDWKRKLVKEGDHLKDLSIKGIYGKKEWNSASGLICVIEGTNCGVF
jgi:hypothetical protein